MIIDDKNKQSMSIRHLQNKTTAPATSAAMDLILPEIDDQTSISLANDLEKLLLSPQNEVVNGGADNLKLVEGIDESLVTMSSTKESKSKRYADLSSSFIKDEFRQLRDALEENADYHNKIEKRCDSDGQSIIIERQGGLANRFVVFLLLLWYLMSAFTLYTNKYIVSSKIADPTLVGMFKSFFIIIIVFFRIYLLRFSY